MVRCRSRAGRRRPPRRSPSAGPRRRRPCAVTLGAASSQARPHPAATSAGGRAPRKRDRSAQAERRALAVRAARRSGPSPIIASDEPAPPAVPRERVEQHRRPLLLDQPADMEDEAGLGLGVAGPEAVEIDAEIMGERPLARDSPAPAPGGEARRRRRGTAAPAPSAGAGTARSAVQDRRPREQHVRARERLTS